MTAPDARSEAAQFLYKHGELTYSAAAAAIAKLCNNGFHITRAATEEPAPLAEALAVPEVAALVGDMLEFLRGLPPDATSGGHCNRDLRARIKQAMLGNSPIRAIGERAE